VNELNNARKKKTNYNYSFGIEGDGQTSTFYDFNNNVNMVNVEHRYLDAFPILFKPL
jgi:hypothetical protein